MRTFIYITLLAIAAVLYILVLPQVLNERNFKTFNDEELRQRALHRGMLPIPDNYDELLKIVDTKENPLSLEKVLLGKKLFFDKQLSKSNEISCSTCHFIKEEQTKKQTLLTSISKKTSNTTCVACHLEEQSGTDRLETAIGIEGITSPWNLNTSTVLNASLAKYLTWTGDVTSLEEHVKNTLHSKYKMHTNAKELEEKLNSDQTYIAMFNSAFDTTQRISEEQIINAIASYTRTLVTRGSYDKFLEGDDNAISQKAKNGLTNFLNFGCKGCHTGMSVGGQNLQKFPLRSFATIYDLRINVSFYPEFKILDTSFPFVNKGDFLGQDITNKFRVPILRNVTKTSPYFHNGSVAKIDEAVDIMAKHQLGINLTPQQREEIVAFLKTLEGDIVQYDEIYNQGADNENNEY